MEKSHEVPMEVPIFASKMDFFVYQCFFVSRVLCQLTIEGEEFVVQGEIYLWESAVTLPVDHVQYWIGKQLCLDFYFFPKQEKLQVSRYSERIYLPTSAYVCIYCYLLLVFRLLLSIRLLNDSFVFAVASHTGGQPLITQTTRRNPPWFNWRIF